MDAADRAAAIAVGIASVNLNNNNRGYARGPRPQKIRFKGVWPPPIFDGCTGVDSAPEILK
jgi:hypothetical protein